MKHSVTRRATLAVNFILILISGSFVMHEQLWAKEDGIQITEIFFDAAGSDSGREWIEIINDIDHVITMSGWKFFEGGTNHSLKEYQGGVEVLPGHYAVIADKPENFLSMYPEYSGVLFDSSFSLSNSGESLVLKDDEGNSVHETDYTPFIESGVAGYSLEKRDDGAWYRSCLIGGTPGEENCSADTQPEINKDVRLNELYPNPARSPESSYEFIELYNPSDTRADLVGWKIRDKKSEKLLSGSIEPAAYRVFYKTVSLNNGEETITLIAPDGEEVDTTRYNDAKEAWSWSRKGDNWKWTPLVTLERENEFVTVDDRSGVHLNEIYANPKDEDDEFIELYNAGSTKMDLQWWSLQDASKSYTFEDKTIILPGQFLVVPRSTYNFALNNTEERVSLVDPHGEEFDSMSYDKTKEETSFNFDGSKWRTSQYLTPGARNIFNDKPVASDVHVDDKIYRDVWAEFSVQAKDKNKEKLRYKWEFGDGKKSYKRETSHKYEETGKYTVQLTISDSSEEVVKKFRIEVKKYPERNVKIRAFAPNPSGKDSDLEWIRLHNYSKKDAKLKGWSVATGTSSKKMTNHPITEEIILKGGEDIILTREDSKFSFNNKKGRIELRYPNGDVAYKVKYNKEGGVEDDEVYTKEDGGSWHWESAIRVDVSNREAVEEKVLGDWDVQAELVGGISLSEPVVRERSRVVLGVAASLGDMKGFIERVFPGSGSAYELRKKDGVYVFTAPVLQQEHYILRSFRVHALDLNTYLHELVHKSF